MNIFEGLSNGKNMVFNVKKAFKRWCGPDATAKRLKELMQLE
jgi:hypothetical protein